MMKLRAIAIATTAGVAVTGPARADDCLSGIPELAADGAKVRACAGDDCLVLTSATSKPEHAKPAPAPLAKPARPIREDHGKHVACAGAVCLPAGPKLVAAAAGSSWQLDIAPDAGVVVVDGKPWDVEHDRVIAVPVPPNAPMDTPHVYALGKILVATWRNCADDYNCTGPIATIVSRAGVQLGKPFPDGHLVSVGAHHAAMVGDGRKLTTFDTETGVQLGTIPLIPATAIEGFSLARLDDGRVGVSWKVAGAARSTVAVIKAPGDKPPSLAWKRTLAECPP